MAPAVPDESAVGTPAEEQAVEPGLIGGPAPGGRTAVLVGYGPRTAAAKRRPRKGATPAGVAAAAAQQAVQRSMLTAPAPVQEPTVAEAAEAAPAYTVGAGAAGAGVRVLAKPPVRKLAKDLGVDLAHGGTGPARAASSPATTSRRAAAGAGAAAPAAAPAYAPGCPVERARPRIPIKGVRKVTAARRWSPRAFTAPHVTEFVTVDVTRTMELRRRG